MLAGLVLVVLPHDILFDPEKCKDKTGKTQRGFDKVGIKVLKDSSRYKIFLLWTKRGQWGLKAVMKNAKRQKWRT